MIGAQSIGGLTPSKKSRRFHRSTYVVAALLSGLSFLLFVPGQRIESETRPYSSCASMPYMFAAEPEEYCEHGWPAVWLSREQDFADPVAPKLPLSLWNLFQGAATVAWGRLLLDILAAGAIVCGVALAYECWRRRRAKLWQIHVSDFLVLVGVTGLMLGWFGSRLALHREEMIGLEQLGESMQNEYGSGVVCRRGLPSWLREIIGDRNAETFDTVAALSLESSESLHALKHFRNLTDLDVHYAIVESGGIRQVAHLKKLEGLNLGACVFDSQDLAVLSELPSLRSLDLSGTKIDDSALTYLTGLQLSKLVLDSTSVSDAGLRELTSLQSLEELSLCSMDITDEGVLHLKSLQRLKHLHLHSERVTRATIRRRFLTCRSIGTKAAGRNVARSSPRYFPRSSSSTWICTSCVCETIRHFEAASK